ncbi:AGE family epimerase/isomerase [Pseudorhodobacter aquimaris]|uniref:AGE family epimerase/isomerase n=1 Tax=Pseudorhodobacter aquimaris TaxID=687412 RepID=UPI00067CD89C|nr:AGE family epimerase/isomerase [Pseudorhodobacter aquimaris]
MTEPSHLLWPLTEAGKVYAAQFVQTGDPDAKAAANACAEVIFTRYISATEAADWVNQLDENGKTLWDAALSRLLYHLAVFVTEGARAGLWQTHR